MALPIPLILGAAALLVLGKKKRKKVVKEPPAGEPDEAPGAGWPQPKPRPDQMGGGFVTARPSMERPPIIGWNDNLAQKARALMTAQWEASDKVLRGGKFFVMMRDTAMQMWPHVKWPLTMVDDVRTVEPRPGLRVPAWIYNLGDDGPKVENIWYRLRDLAWNITGYKPPV